MHPNPQKHNPIARTLKEAGPAAADNIPASNARQAIETAIGYYHEGHWKRAATECEKILASIADHPDALHLLGVIAHQNGRAPEAAELIAKALQISAFNPVYHYSLGNPLKHQGKLNEAIECFEKALQLKPDRV